MTTFNLRVDPDSKEAASPKEHAEERVCTLVIGGEPTPIPKLHIRTHADADEQVVKVDIDFAPENVGVQRQGARGVMRGAQRGAF